jgi:sporulation protein YlmC with PRC-barrel domain
MTVNLVKLGDVGEMVADETQDIRGRKVVDIDGLELGEIDELLIDDVGKIRFLQVETGGILGIGETKSLIPVDAIVSISAQEVHIDHTGKTVAAAPTYRPQLVDEKTFYDNTYSHYGYPPFWGPGHRFPTFPPQPHR